MDPYASATELAAAIRRRQVGPVELIDACLDRVDRLNPDLTAVIWRNDDEARQEARNVQDAVTAGRNLPPFAGIPLPVKDLTAVAGWPLTYGSYAAPDGVGEADELVVAALRRAGFIPTGRTNTPEFGPIPASENVRYGITRNPWDLSRTPGGSSGGAAAAVASGMFPVAHANDGGGSIRIPASCTGLVGLKAGRDRVPAVVPGWLGASVEGAVTRTVADAAAVLDAISSPDPLCWHRAPPLERPLAEEVGAPPGRLRVAVLTRAPLGIPVDETARAGALRAGALLESLGHHVEEAEFELFPADALLAFVPLMRAAFGDYDGIDVTKMEPHNQASYRAGQAVDSLTLVRALGELQRVSRRIVARWGAEIDVLVTPTLAILPPPAGSILRQVHEDPEGMPMDVLSMAAFTAPFNVSGQPAVSLPLHRADDGIPVGVQLVAGPWQEDLLVRLASQLEEADPWLDRHPPLDPS